jgi:preprotein translocase subunit SecD
LDDDGRKAWAQFTTEHVGEDIEVLAAGKVLMKAQLQTPILGGIIAIVLSDPGEIVEVANRLATDGRIEVNAIGRPRQ